MVWVVPHFSFLFFFFSLFFFLFVCLKPVGRLLQACKCGEKSNYWFLMFSRLYALISVHLDLPTCFFYFICLLYLCYFILILEKRCIFWDSCPFVEWLGKLIKWLKELEVGWLSISFSCSVEQKLKNSILTPQSWWCICISHQAISIFSFPRFYLNLGAIPADLSLLVTSVIGQPCWCKLRLSGYLLRYPRILIVVSLTDFLASSCEWNYNYENHFFFFNSGSFWIVLKFPKTALPFSHLLGQVGSAHLGTQTQLQHML